MPYLTVVNVERQSYLQDVAYSVEYVDDPDMYEGDYEVLSKGVYGKADITANVTVINGTETAREVVSSVTLKEPVAERQARGTKERAHVVPHRVLPLALLRRHHLLLRRAQHRHQRRQQLP